MKLCAESAINYQIIKSLNLEDYCYLIDNVHFVDVSKDLYFQRKFNYFYKVRRGNEWRNEYYSVFQSVKNVTISFDEILNELHRRTKWMEPSFSSKMLATINPEMPIWDSHVLKTLGLDQKWESHKTIGNAIQIYKIICEEYKDYKNTTEWRENIDVLDSFCSVYPRYSSVSDVKKIDFLMWANY